TDAYSSKLEVWAQRGRGTCGQVMKDTPISTVTWKDYGRPYTIQAYNNTGKTSGTNIGVAFAFPRINSNTVDGLRQQALRILPKLQTQTIINDGFDMQKAMFLCNLPRFSDVGISSYFS
ncbi:unnamed protein product, partial [Dovyalis caffra]